MFNWLKSLFGKKDKAVDPAFPFPTAKGQDQASMAPYKVEPPVVTNTNPADNVPLAEAAPASASEPKKQVKKSAAPKKKPVAGKPAGTRGRKPKAKSTTT